MQIKESIVIPAYNEALRLGDTLASVETYCAQDAAAGESREVIVVCDGCTDRTERVARSFKRRLPLRVISYRVNRGKGYAVRRGILASRGELAMFMDADGSTPISELRRLSRPINEGEADIVVGSRRLASSRVSVRQSLKRSLLGGLFAWHTRALLGLGICDTQCGFKVFEGGVARDLFSQLRCDRFGFDVELLAMARARGFRMREIGVVWREVGDSTVRPLRDGLFMLATAWRVKLSCGGLSRRAGDMAAPQLTRSSVSGAPVR